MSGKAVGPARGDAQRRPLEMTKWFDTNYHYLVRELEADQRFELRAEHWTGPLAEAAALGIATRAVVLGPLSFLLPSKGVDRPLDLLAQLVPIYVRLLGELAAAGAEEVQLDEPCLARPHGRGARPLRHRLRRAEGHRRADRAGTYFAGLDVGETLERVVALEPAELHLDLVRAPTQLAPALRALRDRGTRLSLGVLDGRNVWAADLDAALARVHRGRARRARLRAAVLPAAAAVGGRHGRRVARWRPGPLRPAVGSGAEAK